MTNQADDPSLPEASHRPRHPIGVVADRTGLSSHVLRAWERRYQVVQPERSEGGHRLYSDADVDRLQLLGRLTRRGRQIGQLAELATDHLADLLREDIAAEVRARPAVRGDGTSEGRRQELSARAWRAVERLDPDALDRVLRRAALTLRVADYMDSFLLPLMQRIGEAWADTTLTPAHEHLATAVAARVTGWLMASFGPDPDGPSLVIATPAGHRHELGAIAAAVIAAAEEWRVRYLGPDLPAEDIARAARQSDARAVALSLVFPSDDAATVEELRTLMRHLPAGTSVFAGGRASGSYEEALRDLGIAHLDSFHSFRAVLSALAAEGGVPSPSASFSGHERPEQR